jgi:hypothetical protein
MKKIRQPNQLPCALLMASMILGGCGGGGGGEKVSGFSPDSLTNTGPSLSGTVIDGYIEGAEVCLDLNGSLSCDGDEPKAITIAGGTFRLDTTGLTSDAIKAAHLLTHVPVTAKDADDLGQTLESMGKSAFSLLAPAAYYVTDSSAMTGAVISPLTTMVSHDMLTRESKLTDAEKAVRGHMDLPDTTRLNQDFVAALKDADLVKQIEAQQLTEKAQILALAIGQINGEMLKAEAIKTNKKQALLAALGYLQIRVPELHQAYKAGKIKQSSDISSVDRVSSALKTLSTPPVTADLAAEAIKTESQLTTPFGTVLAQGIYGEFNVIEACDAGIPLDACVPNYVLLQGKSGRLDLTQRFNLTNKQWVKEQVIGSNTLVLTPEGWVDRDKCAVNQSVTFTVDPFGVVKVKRCSGQTFRMTARTVNASGKTLTELVGLKPSGSRATQAMPQGSALYWVDETNEQDQYTLGGDLPLKKYGLNPQTNIPTEVAFTNLDDYIKFYKTNLNSANPSVTGWAGLRFSFDGDTQAGGTVTLWPNVNGAPIVEAPVIVAPSISNPGNNFPGPIDGSLQTVQTPQSPGINFSPNLHIGPLPGDSYTGAVVLNPVSDFPSGQLTPNSPVVQSIPTNGNLVLFNSTGTVSSFVTAKKPIGKADYVRRKIATASGTQEVLIIKAKAPAGSGNEWQMVAVKDGLLYGGSFQPAFSKQNSEPAFNKTMINAILNQVSMPDVSESRP